MVLRRKDQRLISPARLAELEELAQDGKDMRWAIKRLDPKRYEMMAKIRDESTDAERARGWLEHESDLGDALLEILGKREGTVPDPEAPL